MSVEAILMMLEGVKSSGANRWMALCPVHGDRSPSMGIKECDDGTVLMNCFACGANGVDVAEAVGVSTSELFPFDSNRPTGPTREQRATIEQDKVVMMIYEADKRGGRNQTLADYKRYRLAKERHAAMTSIN
jgi:DNA primase